MAQTINSDDLGQDKQSQLSQQNQGTPQQAGQSGATPSAGSSGSGGTSTGSSGSSGTSAGNTNGGYQQQTGQPAQAQSTVNSYNPNKQQGSGYTNIQKVLSANQGNGLGQAVGSGIQDQTNQTQQNLNNSQQQFNQDTSQNQANTSANSQLVQNVLGNTAQYIPGGANAQQGQQFQQLMSGQYAGPTQLNNSQQIQNQAADVNQLGQATGSQAGQIGLLQRFVGNPQYTNGQQNLDQLLLGQTGQPQLSDARRGALQLQGQVASGLAGAQATGQQQQNQAQNFGQNVQQQFGNTVSGINTGLQQQAQTAQQGADQNYQQTLKDYQSGNISQQEANLLGLSAPTAVTQNQLQNIGQYLTQNPNKATAQNVANAQNYAQIDALRQLGGNSAPSSAQNILQQYAGQDQNAGQFQNQQIQGNGTKFQNDATNQVNQYNSVLTPLNNQLTTDANNYNAYNVPLYGDAITRGVEQGHIAGLKSQLDTDQAKYNSGLAGLQQQYGGLQTINITPQQAALQQLSQGNS